MKQGVEEDEEEDRVCSPRARIIESDPSGGNRSGDSRRVLSPSISSVGDSQ